MAITEREVKPSTIERGLKAWGWTEVIAGVGVVAITGVSGLGLILIGAGGVKLAIIEMQKRKK